MEPVAIDERRFPTMGSRGHVMVVGGPAGLADRAVARLGQLEGRWSRFVPASEVSHLNRAHGSPRLVSGDTLLLVETLRKAWELTGGRFDPTVHDTMIVLGYASSWPGFESATTPAFAATPIPGCGGIAVEHPLSGEQRGLVQLPDDVRLDPGGLGKGLAADIVATELLAAGADGALVNVGGDLRVAGRPATGATWRVGVEDPRDPSHEIARVELADGGVATSTSLRRRWASADGTPVHHIVDPTLGRSADSSWDQATVVAGCAWWAEVLATVAFLDGRLPDPAAGALLVGGDGATHQLGDLSWFALPSAVAS